MINQSLDGRPRFEFHEPNVTTSIRTDQEPQCTCTALVNEVHGNNYQHHHHCPAKPSQVPRLSLNNMFQSTSHSQRQSKPVIYPPLPMLPPTITDSFRQNSLPSPSIEQPPPPPPTTTTSHIESETLVLDPPITNLSNEYYPLINDFLQELSIEMTVKPSVDILLEIEESLAQRIYDCIVEQDDENETETDGQSHSTVTNDSSVAPAVPISANNITSNELPPSPISTTIDEPMDNQEKCNQKSMNICFKLRIISDFQPIREQPVDTFSNLLARHSTPFQQLTKPLQQAGIHFVFVVFLLIISKKQFVLDTRSPFTQSLFEPVNLLRTVHDDNENLNFFSSSFSFHPQQSTKSELSTSSFQRPSASFFNNHLLPPQQPTPNESNLSAFKPIEPLTIRPTGTYLLSRPQLIHHSTGVNWFGQS